MRTPAAGFPARLKAAAKIGDLTPADLANWFARPYPTVRSWLEGREPRGPAGRAAQRRLELLEQAVKERTGFPVPESLSTPDRPRYILRIRTELEKLNDNGRSGVPSGDTA